MVQNVGMLYSPRVMSREVNIIQLMTFDEVNTRVDQFLYSPKLKVIKTVLLYDIKSNLN
jgi:hypothetical protein